MKTKLLLGALIAAASLLHTSPSEAGCAITITFENKTGAPLTITEVGSQVSGATWVTLATGDFTVPANGEATRAYELKTTCALPHSIRAKYKVGSNDAWEQKGPIATSIDKKLKLTFK